MQESDGKWSSTATAYIILVRCFIFHIFKITVVNSYDSKTCRLSCHQQDDHSIWYSASIWYLQIIVGGICDITDKNGPYVTFSERNPRQQLFQAAIQAARKTLGNRIVFSNIASASVSKYNFKYSSAKKRKKGIHIVEPPITNNQKELESEVRDINILIEDEAEENNLPAIKLDQAITCNSIKRRGRAGRKHSSIKVHSYTRLYDGIHGDEKIKKIWCGKIAKAARAAYNTITLALSQGSSQEEDNWEDFKRRRH